MLGKKNTNKTVLKTEQTGVLYFQTHSLAIAGLPCFVSGSVTFLTFTSLAFQMAYSVCPSCIYFSVLGSF